MRLNKIYISVGIIFSFIASFLMRYFLFDKSPDINLVFDWVFYLSIILAISFFVLFFFKRIEILIVSLIVIEGLLLFRSIESADNINLTQKFDNKFIYLEGDIMNWGYLYTLSNPICFYLIVLTVGFISTQFSQSKSNRG